MNNTLLQMALADSAIELWGLGGSTWGSLITGGNDATLFNTPDKVMGSPGLTAGAGLKLNGVDQYATVGTALDGLSGGAWTIGYAFIPTADQTDALIANYRGGSIDGIQLNINATSLTVKVLTGDGASLFIDTTANAVVLNQLNTVFARLDTSANELGLTLNGIVSSPTTMATTTANGNNPTQIGRIHTSNFYFPGVIQAIMLIPSALTDARITLYRNTMLRQASNWHLQPGVGGILN